MLITKENRGKMNPRGENKLSDAKRGRVMLDYFISKYSLDEKTIRNRF
jgi:hypothetical protein